MSRLQAVIFDLDGTLVDTEAVWTEALRRWMAKYGKTYDPTFQKQLMGKLPEVGVQLLAEKYGLTGDMETWLKERKESFHAALDDMGFVEKPGACDFVKALAQEGMKIGLATSSEKNYAERALKSISCREYFSTVTTLEDIKNGKPAPDIYLAAAERLQVAPVEALAFEDAPAGVASANAAGMKVVGMVDPRYVEALPDATLQVTAFEELSMDRLKELFVK